MYTDSMENVIPIAAAIAIWIVIFLLIAVGSA